MNMKSTFVAIAFAMQIGMVFANAASTPGKSAGALPPPAAAAKQCYLFNPPSYDRQWTVPCEPTAVSAPTKMCPISNTMGWDAALFTAPCEPVTRSVPMRMCRISNTTGWDAALFTEPCENQERRNASITK